jgi:Zn-dependent protease
VEKARGSWSINVGSLGGIPIRIHLTFLLLLIWLVFGSESASPLHEALFVIAVFTCVLLHELGHALVAKRFGVLTRDITLYPFGGIAAIVSQPAPRAELLISIAGPAVNIVIAAAIYPFITLPDISKPESIELTFLLRLFLTNIALATFNLLPALPMDGGRVLRAVLGLCDVKNATFIAARISQGICLLLAVSAVYLEQPVLFAIAVIVFLGAMQEHVRAQAKTIASAFSIEDAMIPMERLQSFPHGTTISRALKTILTSWQPLYPVMNGNSLLGIVTRDDILEHAVTRADDYVGELMQRSIPEIDVAASLADAYAQMESSGNQVLAVTKDGSYRGILALDRLADFLIMHELRAKMPKDDDMEWTSPNI